MAEAESARPSGTCPLCRKRKAKRPCPAKRAGICSQCCGTKRRVEIACPEDCVYLKGEHAHGWEGRETERRRDLRRLAPHLEGLTEDQARLLFVTLAGLQTIRARRRDMDDRLLGQALGALRKTVETRVQGILYEHAAEDLRAQGILHDVRGLFEASEGEGRSAAPSDADLLAVLSALEAALARTRSQESDPAAFLDTLARIVGRFGPSPAAAPSGPLIVEP